MSRPRRLAEIEALLREPVEDLPAAPEVWERISHRAQRRRTLKAAGSVLAVAVVVAGAIPAVLAVRDHADDQTLAIGRTPVGATSAGPAGAGRGDLSGFFPDSLSFVTATEGYVWGSIGDAPAGVVARTLDGGATWSRMAAPAVDDTAIARHGGDDQIRFANADVGFVYGSDYFVTHDGAASWQRLSSPGYIDALETRDGKVWALVRPCAHCRSVTLYGATVADPRLRVVRQVEVMHGRAATPTVAGTAAIATSDRTVDVLVGSSGFWRSTDGLQWRAGRAACPAQLGGGATLMSAALSAPGGAVLLAACGYAVADSTEVKFVYRSTDGGRSWTRTRRTPGLDGYLGTISAGTEADIVVGTNRGAAMVSHNGGATWSPAGVPGVSPAFVGFISGTHVVAVGGREGAVGGFASSEDAGRTWTIHRFP